MCRQLANAIDILAHSRQVGHKRHGATSAVCTDHLDVLRRTQTALPHNVEADGGHRVIAGKDTIDIGVLFENLCDRCTLFVIGLNKLNLADECRHARLGDNVAICFGALITWHPHATIIAKAQNARAAVINQAARSELSDAIAVACNLNRTLAKITIDANQAQTHLGIRLGTNVERINDNAIDHVAAEHLDIGTLAIWSIGTIAQQHLEAVFCKRALDCLHNLSMKRTTHEGDDHANQIKAAIEHGAGDIVRRVVNALHGSVNLIASLLANVTTVIENARHRSRRNPRHRSNFLNTRLASILRTTTLATHKPLSPISNTCHSFSQTPAYPNNSRETASAQPSKQHIQKIVGEFRLKGDSEGPRLAGFGLFSKTSRRTREAPAARSAQRGLLAYPRTFWKITQIRPQQSCRS